MQYGQGVIAACITSLDGVSEGGTKDIIHMQQV